MPRLPIFWCQTSVLFCDLSYSPIFSAGKQFSSNSSLSPIPTPTVVHASSSLVMRVCVCMCVCMCVCVCLLLFVVSIQLSGTLMGGLCLCCDMGHPFKTSQTNSDVLLPCIIIGLAQFLSTVFLLAGWIWALAWSILFCTCSCKLELGSSAVKLAQCKDTL